MSNRVSMARPATPQIEAGDKGQPNLQPRPAFIPSSLEIAIGAALWFVVMAWLDFARDGEIDYLLAIVTLFFVMFFTLFLLTASYSAHDPRWPSRDTSFREFLRPTVGTATGSMRGRDVLIEIALVPSSLGLRRDADRACSGQFFTSCLTLASSASRSSVKSEAIHSASSRRSMSPICGPLHFAERA